MEQKKFQERLNDVVYWTNNAEKGPDADEPNDTRPIRVTKLKPHTEICEDCGVVVENRRKHYKLSDNRFGKQWRESCATCKKHKNPFTGEFDMTAVEAVGIWREFLIKNNQK